MRKYIDQGSERGTGNRKPHPRRLNSHEINDAWAAGSKLLIKAVSAHLTKKQPNLKLFIGIEYTVIKQTVDYEDQDPDEIILKEVGKPKPMMAKTNPVHVYNLESVKPTIL